MNLLRIGLVAVLILLSRTSGAAGEPRLSRTVLYEAGQQGYFTYRIASLVATKEGSLLAFAAARKGKGGDWDPINIVQRRSTDAGRTWAPLRVVVADGDLPCDNAMPITDYVTGDVHLLYQIDYARCYYTKSADDGVTWSRPVDLTAPRQGDGPDGSPRDLRCGVVCGRCRLARQRQLQGLRIPALR